MTNVMVRRFGFVAVLAVLELVLLPGDLDAAVISRATGEECDHKEFFFKKQTYRYDYVVSVTNGFLGVSDTRTGSRITCTVILDVRRRCDVAMQLRNCLLGERDVGSGETYTEAGDQEFMRDLERYPVHFQTSKGVILEESIHAASEDTLQSLNVKRGLISAVQYQILQSGQYDRPVPQTDIFGTCSTKYTVSTLDSTVVTTSRNLRQCDIRQIFKTQFTSLLSSVRQVLGGFKEGPISEGIYPFTTEIVCDYTINDKHQLEVLTCLQTQLFKPLAYTDAKSGNVYTASSTVSQDLRLVAVNPEDDKPGHIQDPVNIGIKFDFGTDEAPITELADVEAAMNALLDEYINSGYTYENVPNKYEELVQEFRNTRQNVLEELSMELFDCPKPCIDQRKMVGQKFFLDALESCGSEDCMLAFFHCAHHGHVSETMMVQFVVGLTHIQVPESVTNALYMRCYDRCYTMKMSSMNYCMLAMGTVLSKHEAASVLDKLLGNLGSVLETNCNSDILTHSERQLIIAIKTLENIGSDVILQYEAGLSDPAHVSIYTHMHSCLQNKNIPFVVRRTVMELSVNLAISAHASAMPASIKETYFTLLQDVTEEITIRVLSFGSLAKTLDTVTLQRLVDFIQSTPDNEQLQAYMESFLRSLLDNNMPDIQPVREAWEAILKENQVYLHSLKRLKPYDMFTSKSINLNHYMKFIWSEIIGGDFFLDVVYDPASYVSSAFRIGLNYYYKDKQYNIFQIVTHAQGFNQLFEAFSEHIDFDAIHAFIMAHASGHGKSTSNADFAKFQQNIMAAVKDIIDKVNHPLVKMDFDIDIKIHGKHVRYGSLSDLHMALMSNTPYLKGILKKLVTGLPITLFKGAELASLVKVLPTCGGLPMNLSVSLSGLMRFENKFQSNLVLHTAPMTFQHDMHTTITYEMNSKLSIPVGNDEHSSGLHMKVVAGSERGSLAIIKYGYDDPIVQVANPYKRKLQFDLHPIEEDRDSEKLFYVKSEMHLIHFSGHTHLHNDHAVESTYVRCASPKFSMLLGRSLCATLVYPNVTKSTSHAYFPLSGPFTLDVQMAKVDSVSWYNLIWEYSVEQVEGGLADRYTFTHLGNGDVMNRLIYINASYNQVLKEAVIESGIPELQLEYRGSFTNIPKSYLQLSEFFKSKGAVVSGYELVMKTSEHYRLFHWNFTLPYVGLEVHVEKDDEVVDDKLLAKNMDISLRYHCSQNFPFLYMVHMFPHKAMENGDTGSFHWVQHRIMHYDGDKLTHDKQSDVIQLYDKELTSTMTVDYLTEQDYSSHQLLQYTAGGEQKSFSVTGLLHKAPLGDDGLEFNLEMTYEADSFLLNSVLVGSHVFHKSLELTMKSEYENKEIQARKKRSASVEKLPEAISHHDHSMSLPQIDTFPSVWDLPTFKASLEFECHVDPIFTPGNDTPTALESYVTVHHKHPWNGGYRVYDVNMTVLHDIEYTFENYRFLFDVDKYVRYTDLDGTPILDENNQPLTTSYHVDAHLHRIVGKTFDFGVNVSSEALKSSYSVLYLYDMESIDHEQPLVHVVSNVDNTIEPFFNHHYDESLIYVPGRVKHLMMFSHAMLNITGQTDLQYAGPIVFEQSGTCSLYAMGQERSMTFTNGLQPIPGAPPYVPRQIVLSVIFGSMHEKTFIYEFRIPKLKALDIISSVVPAAEAPAIELWKSHIELRGTSLVHVTNSWQPVIHANVTRLFMSHALKNAYLLDALSKHMTANMDVPFLDQTIFLTNTSLHDVFHFTLGRVVTTIELQKDVFFRNFVPVTYQHQPENGVYIPPRLAVFHQLTHQERERAPLLKRLQAINYYIVRAMYYAMLGMNRLAHSTSVKDIIDSREYTYMIDLHLNIAQYKRKEGNVVLTSKMQNLVKQATMRYVFGQKSSLRRLTSVGVVIGPHGTNRPLDVKTFDANVLHIPAQQANECSYLLATDLMSQKWSVILTPAGLTLASTSMTVSIGWHKQLHIDDCKVERTDGYVESSDGHVNVSMEADAIVVDTDYGVTLKCDTSNVDLCFITLHGQRNGTIGLMGTNDEDKYTDDRLINGQLASSHANILTEYVVDGPASCKIVQPPPVPEKQPCEPRTPDNPMPICMAKLMSLGENKRGLFRCLFGRESFDFQSMIGVCQAKAAKCDTSMEDLCYNFKAIVDMCKEKGLVHHNITYPDECATLTPHPNDVADSSTVGSLDIVFVVSQHQSMLEYKKNPWQYVADVADMHHEAWKKFDDVRLGFVGFSGDESQELDTPHVLYNSDTDNRYFKTLDEYVSEPVLDLEANGGTGSDGFLAVAEAAKFPFKPTSHKMIVLIMTKEQSPSGKAVDREALVDQLKEQGIILNVISSYSKLSSRRVIGINWKEKVISRLAEYQEHKQLPNNDYAYLIKETNGALWDLSTLTNGRKSKIQRIVEEFVSQTTAENDDTCDIE